MVTMLSITPIVRAAEDFRKHFRNSTAVFRVYLTRGTHYEPLSAPTRTLIEYPFSTPCASSAARWPPSALFPPRGRKQFHDAVLEEINEERVASSRNRRNPRGVKRKMSNYPLRKKLAKPLPPIDIQKAIQILK